jgi:hypothetical protein
MVALAHVQLAQTPDPCERWQLVRQFIRELTPLRRFDHQSSQRELDRLRWEHEDARFKREHQEREQADLAKIVTAPFQAAMEFETLKTVYGDTPAGREAAATIAEVNHRLERGTLRQARRPSAPGNPAWVPPCSPKSSSIQPC